jgi:hypothetical protein
MSALGPYLSTPTFNQSSKSGAQKPGWYSRLIYSYNYHDNKQPYALDEDAFGQLASFAPENQRGTYIFPAGYLDSINALGRRYRVKGSFLYDTKTNTNQALNFKVGVTGTAGTPFVRNSDGNTHRFAGYNSVVDVPVTFEADIIIVAKESTSWYYKVSGFYQYEWQDYANGGTNNKDVFVPIHQTDVFSSVNPANQVKIFMIIGSSANCNLIPIYFTIEEIG